MSREPLFHEALLTPYHAFVILNAGALVVSLLWPDPRFGRSLFLDALILLQGILSLQVGEAECGFGPRPPEKTLLRLLALGAMALVLVSPLVLVHRAETAATWPAVVLSLGFLLVHGFVWSLVGHGMPRVVRSEGLRFLAKYGGLALAEFLPLGFGLPGSGLATLRAIWEGHSAGWSGAVLYLGLGGLGALWLLRSGRKTS